jgi:hypothetical protein
MRVLRFLAISTVVWTAAANAGFGARRPSEPRPATEVALVATAVFFGILLLGLPKVSYRLRDVLMVFIPIYSAIFLIRICWRLASLPDRYWRPRPGERPPQRRGAPPPGPRPDPDQPGLMRFWDGSRWVGEPWAPGSPPAEPS